MAHRERGRGRYDDTNQDLRDLSQGQEYIEIISGSHGFITIQFSSIVGVKVSTSVSSLDVRGGVHGVRMG